MTPVSRPAAPSRVVASTRRRELVLVVVLSLLTNALAALLTSAPSYVDDSYYFNGGLRIATGQSQWPELAEPYFWNYVAASETLPAPGFAYWQPLASLLAALGIGLLRFLPPFRAAQVAFTLVAALVPVLAYLLAEQLGDRRHARVAALLATFSGVYVRYWSLPESFTPFAVSTSAALLLAGVGRQRGRWWSWAAAGVCGALAHLSRADGLLVPAVVGLVALLPGELPHRRLRNAVLVVVAYGLTMAPWFARNYAIFGSVQAPGGLSTLWLVDYNDLFAYPPELSAASYFEAGLGVIAGTKLRALGLHLLSFAAVHNLVFLTPLTLASLARRWRRPLLLPAVLYGVLMFAAMTFAFTLPGMRGGWLHSSSALVPFVMANAALGLDDAIRWVAARRSAWNARSAWRVFSAGSVGLALLVTIILPLIGTRQGGGSQPQRSDPALYGEIGETLAGLGVSPHTRVMSNNTPAFHLATGYGGIPVVNGDESALLRAADDYQVTYLVLDHNVVPELRSVYEEGPTSARLKLLGTYGGASRPVYLYEILPPE